MYYGKKKTRLLEAAQKAVGAVLGALASSVGDGSLFEDFADFVPHSFYGGNEVFLDAPADGARWRMGFAQASLAPKDIDTHAYYLGGYFVGANGFNNHVEEIIDDMKVRAFAADDGSGRGVSLFAVIDCIGIANADIRRIRRALERKAKDEFVFASVNVCSTHTHSCVDTEGLWNGGLGKIFRNYRVKRGGGIPERGTDAGYMDFLCDTVSDVLLTAARSMCAGELSFAQKDLGEEYFSNRNRPGASALENTLTRLLFRPDDPERRPAVIALMNAHPDCAGFPTKDGSGSGRELSGDYIYYFGDFMNRAGYDFLFFNGAVCAIYMDRGPTNDGLPLARRYEQSARYGTELAKITLAMTMTREEIEADDRLADRAGVKRDRALAENSGGVYTLWYEGHEPVEEVPVEPYLNVRLRQIFPRSENPVILLAGKLDLTDFKVLRDGDGYRICTEVGYLEFGSKLRAVMVPGEYCCDLLKGGSSLTREGSFTGTEFTGKTVREIFGDGTLCIGMANDEIGYIVPDNDYILGDFANHYHEILSIGRETGSFINGELEKLAAGIKREKSEKKPE